MPKLTLACILLLVGLQVQAQKYTRQDSLRGTLNEFRKVYNVHYYDLNLKVNPQNKSIRGSNTIHFQALDNFHTIQIDLFENMDINRISQEGKELKFKREGNATFVSFPKTIKKGKLSAIKIDYSGVPRIARMPPWDGGFTWTKDQKGNAWIGVSCEGIGASLWWPNKDHLSDEPDSMRIACSVPEELTCVANGNLRRISEVQDGYRTYDWFVSYPINNYNVSLNIAKYTHFSDTYLSQDNEKLALDYYVLAYNEEKAKKHFEQVKPMLACFEKFFGKYPFWRDGYALVETPYLGMEHQGAIAYGNNYLAGYRGSDRSGTGWGLKFDYLIIHESGHEYWGNSVSCNDHAEMWIHESFCTYSESLYVECLYGKEAGRDYVYGLTRNISNRKPIVAPLGVNAEGSSDMYDKGAVMLHTLRNVIDNDDLWFDIIKSISQDYLLKNIDGQEVIEYFNKKSGMDLTSIFEQYLYHRSPPRLEYKINDDQQLEYRWLCEVENFKMPIQIEDEQGKLQTIRPSKEWQTLEIALPKKGLKLKEKAYYIQLTKK